MTTNIKESCEPIQIGEEKCPKRRTYLMKLKTRDKILLYLYDHRFHVLDTSVDPSITTIGMSEGLGINRTSVSRTLKTLVADGLLLEEYCYVEGRKQKVKAYQLTEKGEKEGFRLQSGVYSHEKMEFILLEEAMLYRRLGRVFWRKNDYDRAIKYYERGLNIARINGFAEVEGNTLIDLGNAFDELDRAEEAIATYVKAIPLLRSSERGRASLSRLYNNMGIVYQRLEKWEKCIECCDNALDAEDLDDHDTGSSYLESAYCYAHLGEFKKAKELVDEASKIFEDIADNNMIAGCWKVKGVIQREKGNYRKSLDYLEIGLKILPPELKYTRTKFEREIQKTKSAMAKDE